MMVRGQKVSMPVLDERLIKLTCVPTDTAGGTCGRE
jgi:hypothetical protein